MNWTKEQLDVIETRDKNILVSAAAGSGKTAVLVERIVKLVLEDRVPIENFLIVTFTNAAAKGMKIKIQKSFNNILSKPENYEKEYIKFIREQMNSLSKSSISTIHVFCLNVIRDNFNYLELDPGFKIGDEIECSLLLSDSIEEILEEKFEEKDAGFINLVNTFSGNRTDDKLIALLSDVYNFIQSFPEPEVWLDGQIEKLNVNENDIKNSDWIKNIMENITEQLSSFISDSSMKEIEHSLSKKSWEFASAAMESDKMIVHDLSDSLSEGYEKFVSELMNIEFKRKSNAKKAPEEIAGGHIADEELAYKYCSKKLTVEIKKMQDSIPNKTTEELAEDIRYMHPLVKTLAETIKEISDRFQMKKREKTIIDFNDFEHFAYKALSNEEIAKYYREKYDYIFIDEYQDSNQIQEALISKIKRDNNLFMVGDSKQSIYKFRLADVEIFTNKLKAYSLSDNELNKRIDLNKNFRSRKEILNGINFIFSNIMTEKLGELNYDEDVYLYPGMKFYSDDTTVPEVNLIVNFDGEEIPEQFRHMKNREVEARFIASRIKELVGKPKYEASSDIPSKIEYKDIVILTRAIKSWSDIFQNVFSEEGIPFYQDAGSGYYETLEIQIVLNYLKIIDNLRQEIPLLSVMRSPIYRFTADELTKIRVKNLKCSYLDAVMLYRNQINDSIAEKINKLLNDVKKFKQISSYISVNELIWEIVIYTNYYDFVGALPNGELRQANLRLLSNKAKDYEATSMTGLYNFIKYVDRLKFSGNDNSEAKVIAENADVVRAMTIHKSKGLEFPIVFIAGLSSKFNMLDMNSAILKHKNLGFAPKYLDSELRIKRETLPRYAVKNIMKKEIFSEEMRILYVALTRAQDKLILTGCFKSLEKKALIWEKELSNYNLLSVNCYMDWIMMVLYKHRDASRLRELLGDDESYSILDKLGTSWKFNVISNSEIVGIDDTQKSDCQSETVDIWRELEDESKTLEVKINDSVMKKEIEDKLNFVYPYGVATRVPTKMSVTEIKRFKNKDKKISELNIDIPRLLSIPSFKNEEKLTPAEIGTITHEAMQHIDIKNVASLDAIEKQIDNMIDYGFINEKEAEVIQCDKIFNFFLSDIGKRMIIADEVYREAPFIYKMNAASIYENYENVADEIVVQGIIDCYFIENDEIILLDYKTDKVDKNTLENVKQRYIPQLNSYREALQNITGKKVKESYLYLFYIDTAIEI